MQYDFLRVINFILLFNFYFFYLKILITFNASLKLFMLIPSHNLNPRVRSGLYTSYRLAEIRIRNHIHDNILFYVYEQMKFLTFVNILNKDLSISSFVGYLRKTFPFSSYHWLVENLKRITGNFNCKLVEDSKNTTLCVVTECHHSCSCRKR